MDLTTKTRQLAKLEYRANRDLTTTIKNLRKVFGYHSIDSAIVQSWFEEFEYKKTAKFTNDVEYDTKLIKRFPNGTQDFMNGMLSQVEFEAMRVKFNTFDGRLAYGITDDEFIVCDMFHGEYKWFSFNFGMDVWRPIESIDEKRFLVFDDVTAKLHLYKFDFDVSTLEHLDSTQLDRRLWSGFLALDESDPTKFIIYRLNQFCSGKVVGNKIEIGEVSQAGVSIQHSSLKKSKIQSVHLVNSSSCKLYELDLNTNKLTSKKIPTEFGNGKKFDLSNLSYSYELYAWSGHYFYIAYNTEDGYWKVAALDTKTLEWFDTNVQIWQRVHKMYVDRNGFLTVIAYGSSSTFSFYRFTLKKPDSLMNLAWFSYTNTFKKTNKRGKLFKRLPYNCHLRLELPGIEQETDMEEE